MDDHVLLHRALRAYRDRPLTGESADDLWPRIARRFEATSPASRLDVALGVVLVLALCLAPQGLWFVAYHL